MGWTAEQISAINEKNGNILVSAAAGSGKTAVLVERIIRLITDEDNPVDIDRLLVVTFTKAAVAEMKERIGAAVNLALRENPDSANLRRQSVLLNHADITTIHSFCLRVARENYNWLGIDPAFRVADDTEILLLQDEIMDRLFEDNYASDDPDGFLYMVENYSDGTSDKKLRELVLKIFNFIRSHPDPQCWIEKQKAAYVKDSGLWFDILKEQISAYVKGAMELTKSALGIAESTGPETYIPMLVSDLEKMEYILEGAELDFNDFYLRLLNMSFDRLSTKKCESATKEKVKFLRDRAKKIFVNINSKFLLREPDSMLEDIKNAGYGICLLLDLVGEFSLRFDKEKKQRRIADYSDLEHYCLKVLMDKDGTVDNPVKSKAAMELTEKYEYVMTDEYQDSNAVQELILSLVSTEKNRFMVGDVKQSIYSFRMANPDIFTEKYNTFSLKKGAANERIDMFKNFRSRSEVLEGINFIFMQLMQKELGGIEYDENAMLYTGAEFPVYTGSASAGGAVEIDIINTDYIDEESEEDLSNMEKEMSFVADRINSLMYGKDRLEIYDPKLGDYRKLKFSDIVIIMRKKTYGASFVEILRSRGIPSSAESSTGFLDTTEVMTALSFLRIIDNPRQDIPLAAVLRSPVYGLSADDLLTIKLEVGCDEYWDCIKNYDEYGTSDSIKKTLSEFLLQLEHWRNISVEKTINDLIWAVYTDTGYYDLAGVLPDGKARQANLMKLVKKASDYDSLSFKGLFDFIRYIEKIDRNDVEIDSESGCSQAGVRIMTIHKSKGLEFPVVFISGCGGKFNKTDLSANVVLHKKLGIGSEYVDAKTRVKYNTVPRAVISEALWHDSVAEEIRVLYVAMTRAKEKLIITGYASENPARAIKWQLFSNRKEVTLPAFELSSCDNYLDWIMEAVARHRNGRPICDLSGEQQRNIDNGLFDHKSIFEVNFINAVSKAAAEREDETLEVKSEEDRAFLKQQIDARLGWEYPYSIETQIPGTVSVSDVKRMRGTKLSHTVKKPDFYIGEKGLSPTDIGTAVHKVFEHMDFRAEYDYDSIKALIESMVNDGILTAQEGAAVSIKRIEMFAKSELYNRILKSEEVYKEEAFTVSITPEEIYRNDKFLNIDEAVILHGRVDCYFVENDEIVLVDYKTDYYDEENEEKFRERYDIQMELYTNALERVTGLRVKECCIYSVSAGKTINFK